VTFFSIGQLLVLFVLQMVLARYFGGDSADLHVYWSVQAVPLVIGAVLAGSLSSVIIPLSNELHEAHGDAFVETVLNRLGWILLACGVGLSILLFLFARPFTGFLFPGFSKSQILLGTEMLQILCWLVPLNTATSFLFSVFHSRKRFLLPALSGLVGPTVTVVLVVAYSDEGVRGIAWATLAGGVVGVVLLSMGFPRSRTAVNFPLRPVLERFCIRLFPLVLGAAYYQLDPIVDGHLASYLTIGSFALLSYARRLMIAVAMIATSGLSVVAFPAIARHAAAGDQQQFVSELAHAWRFLCVVMMPMIGGILCFNKTLVSCLLERGEFTATDTEAVAGLMSLYAGVILAAGIGEIAARAFYALGNTWTPTLIGIFGFTLGAVAKFYCVSVYKTQGLAMLTSGYYLLNAVLFLIILRWRLNGPLFTGLGRTFGRSLISSTVALGLAWLILDETSTFRVLAGVGASIICYVAMQLLLRDEFALRLFHGALGAAFGRNERN
jgi:putative peptidoglycan lipid II flippase